MNVHLENIKKLLQDTNLPEAEKQVLLKQVSDADKQWAIIDFKLDRTEKVKRTTAILLEETIEELEQKRKAVEAQNRELEIETGLERVRTVAMAMRKPTDLLEICKIVYAELHYLGFGELRNAMINIHYDNKGALLNYDYSDEYGKTVIDIPYNFHPLVAKQIANAKNANDAFFEFSFVGDELKAFRELRKNNGEKDDPKLEITNALHYYFYSIGTGAIGISTYSSISEDKLELLKRFRNVFNLSYQRYTDIILAETQAREAQIEAALERTRTQSMIMQHSKELDDTLRVFHEQIQLLGINSAFSFLWLPDEEKHKHKFWAAWVEEKNSSTIFKSKAITYPLDRYEPATAQCLVDWKSDEPVHSYAVPPEGVENYFVAWKELFDGVEKLTPEHFRSGLYYVEAFMKYGCFGVTMGKDLTEDEKKILGRFAIEFERTYTRFLDLQKAEAQTREAEIELALERVRARTMAMQKSDELIEAATVLFQQIEMLGGASWNCGFNVWDEDRKYATAWNGSKDGIGQPFKTPSSEDVFLHFYEASQRGESLYVEEIGGQKLENHYRYLSTLPGVGQILEEFKTVGIALPTFQIFHIAYFSHGYLMFITYEPVPELWDVFKRFAKVFEQTYTRFLDLQKAEAQAREAQIQLAMERVRARTMAMQKSEELGDISFELVKQVQSLGVATWHCAFNVYDEDQNSSTEWGSNAGGTYPRYKTPREGIFLRYYEIGQTGETLHIEVIGEDKCADHYAWLCTLPGVGDELLKLRDAGLSFPASQIDHVAYFKHGYLIFITYAQVPEAHEIFKRFAKIFEQTYTRFLDLQKAEAQAREATIEAALERVRSKAMAMHNSQDLADTIGVFYKELQSFSLTPRRCGVGLLDNEDRMGELFTWNTTDQGESLELVGRLKMEGHPVLDKVYDSWVTQKEYHPVLRGNEIKEYYKILKPQIAFPDYNHDDVQFGYFFFFQEGGVYAWTEKELTEDELNIYRRFTSVLSLTYKRYKDLKQSEAQTREAQIEAGLERVRSRTLAMQKSDELAETVAVLFKQLILLGIAPNRLYIGIVKEESEEIEFWVTDKDGSKVSKQFTGDINRNTFMHKMYDSWKQQIKSLTIDMQGAALENYFHYLKDELHVPFKDGPSQKRRIQTIAYFSRGFIGMASPDDQPEEATLLLERFAGVFNLTFTRFNDLKDAEAHDVQAEEDLIKLQTEKKRAEVALAELQTAQKQLIQSEKMASLGELTAGIAHEIQNPLNFVNNFSEVSKELLDEMKTALDNGDAADAKAIASDVIQNLEKINHHGRRADAIVKGMLQHSRSSSATKEPTDINALTDEYIRLCYHGLRAKDKSFNATIKTDFDATTGNVNIIPQDIGRVILNLLTNAFYAVNEKALSAAATPTAAKYEPTVSVSTKKTGDKVEIRVSDNGNGIPQTIADKIFQPFFTTKPTGQGTGLGLSLSYDIIKAHKGEIKMETNKGEGSEFIIQLPITQ